MIFNWLTKLLFIDVMDTCVKEISSKKYLENSLETCIIHETTTKDEKCFLHLDELDEYRFSAYKNAKSCKEETSMTNIAWKRNYKKVTQEYYLIHGWSSFQVSASQDGKDPSRLWKYSWMELLKYGVKILELSKWIGGDWNNIYLGNLLLWESLTDYPIHHHDSHKQGWS